MDFKFVYKICTKAEWLEAKTKGKFNGSKKDIEDGYIHFSDKEQLKGTLAKFFSNVSSSFCNIKAPLSRIEINLGFIIFEYCLYT